MPEPSYPDFGPVKVTDVAWRDVFEDAAGQQFVYGDDGEPVCGLWLILREEADGPMVVDVGRGGFAVPTLPLLPAAEGNRKRPAPLAGCRPLCVCLCPLREG